jgi:serine/threonine protein kinase
VQPGQIYGNGRFEIVSQLGSGGMGVVYQAFDRQRQAQVALKTLRQLDGRAVARLKREFRALQDLDHPNLVTLFELISENDSWFFTMELVEGVNFLEWVHGEVNGPIERDTDYDFEPGGGETLQKAPSADAPLPLYLDEERLRSVLAQLAGALATLHRGGKVHRDIKPSNLLVRENGQLVLLDFGLVADLYADRRSSGDVVGTVEYMAPEQAAAERIGPQADWYAAGAVLYQALTGRPPFTGTPLQILEAKRKRVPPAPGKLAASVPADLSALCMDLLHADPQKRPSEEEVLERLRVPAPRADTQQQRTFVGRARELLLLGNAFESVQQGRAKIVLVHGPSGVGKSQLARHFARGLVLRQPETLVLASRHYEHESLPYRAADSFIDALMRYLQPLPPEEAAALLPRDAALLAEVFPPLRNLIPEWLPSPLAVDRLELRHRLFIAVRELCEKLARWRPTVLIIDDIQWADTDSRLMLAETMRSPAPPMLYLLTLRTRPGDELTLKSWLDGLRHYDAVSEIELGGLSSDESRELASQLLGDQLASKSGAIADEAGGHPLFIDALARHTRMLGSEAPTRLRLEEALEARMAVLDPPTRRLFDLLAVSGGPLPHETARRAAGMDYAEFMRRSSALKVAGLLQTSRVRDREALDTFHDRVRETALEKLSPEVLRALHERLARALESNDRPDAEKLFNHHLGAGHAERAAHYAALAAEQAEAALAFKQAVRLYHQAVKLCPDAEGKRRLRVRLAGAFANEGRGRDAADVYQAALEGAPPEEALDLRRRAAEQLLRAGLFAEGLEAMRELLASAGMTLHTSARRAQASYLWSRAALRLRGLDFRERPLDQITKAELSRIDLCWSVASGLSVVDTLRAAQFQSKHLEWALASGEPFRIARALALEVGLTAASGKQGKRAAVIAARAEDLAQRVNQPYALAWARGAHGVLDALEGRWREGLARLKEAEETSAPSAATSPGSWPPCSCSSSPASTISATWASCRGACRRACARRRSAATSTWRSVIAASPASSPGSSPTTWRARAPRCRSRARSSRPASSTSATPGT